MGRLFTAFGCESSSKTNKLKLLGEINLIAKLSHPSFKIFKSFQEEGENVNVNHVKVTRMSFMLVLTAGAWLHSVGLQYIFSTSGGRQWGQGSLDVTVT